jgi:hypothetical protein
MSHPPLPFKLHPLLLALILAAATVVPALVLPQTLALDLLALLLAGIAGVYVGFAIADGRGRALALEAAVALAFLAVAALGLWWSPLALVVGYAAHGVWDVVHHPHRIDTRLAPWYPPFCAVYDWLVAASILLWLR